MFSYIKGKLVEKEQGYVVVDVNGVGFKIFTSQNTLSDSKCAIHDDVTFYTYLYIKLNLKQHQWKLQKKHQ